MNNSTGPSGKLLLTAVIAAGTILAAGCSKGSPFSISQQTPSIAFITPAPGATVERGKSIQISLKVQNAAAFTDGIFVVGQGELGAVPVPTQPPFETSLAVPAGIELGTYTLTAAGHMGTAENPISATTVVTIVPNPAIPILLQPPAGGLVFEAIGERLPITVPGATSGLQFKSDAPDIATVSGPGIVIAQKTGNTSITVTLNGSFIGAVPVRVLAPQLSPSVASIDFGNQGTGTQSSPQTVTITNNATYPVTIMEVNSGTIFPESDNCISSSPLAPGVMCTISISFSPAATGAVAGALEIIDSAVIAPTRILLSGTGT